MNIVKVLLPISKLFPLDYIVPEDLELEVGDLVIVSFRNKEITGIVWEVNVQNDSPRLKYIKSKSVMDFRIGQETLELLKKASNYYFSKLGCVAKLVLQVDVSKSPIKLKKQDLPDEFLLSDLSEEQHQAFSQIKISQKPSLIKGVTGSGKTEIYFKLVAEYLKQNRQVLIMLPEIALSNQIIQRFTTRFGFEPEIWNSSITKSKKKMILRGILTGDVKMIIGARSTLFLPYKDLGLIVVDEEHDSSYKQEDGVIYHARDMAVLKSTLSDTKVLLCSATPSIETIYNAQIGKYQLIELTTRYKKASMPSIEIIDMRIQRLSRNSWLSDPLVSAITEALNRKEQVLLFLNRRGYSPLILCKLCGYRFNCPSCSAWLVLHKLTKRMECHHCGHTTRIHINCPECLETESLIACGPGIERIEEETLRLFPKRKIAIISKDQLSKPNKVQELLSKMENQEIEILIGTQIITKGYHFPNLTLVGVIDADLGFNGTDLRSSERTFQLLHQVGGRAGREGKRGTVLLQTYYPENTVLTTLKNDTEEAFLNNEIENRRIAEMPPFTRTALMILTSKEEYKVEQFAKQLVSIAPKSDTRILGPAKGTMSKLAGKYRYRILIISDKKFNLQKYLSYWLDLIKIPSSIQIKIDIDPQNFN